MSGRDFFPQKSGRYFNDRVVQKTDIPAVQGEKTFACSYHFFPGFPVVYTARGDYRSKTQDLVGATPRTERQEHIGTHQQIEFPVGCGKFGERQVRITRATAFQFDLRNLAIGYSGEGKFAHLDTVFCRKYLRSLFVWRDGRRNDQ